MKMYKPPAGAVAKLIVSIVVYMSIWLYIAVSHIMYEEPVKEPSIEAIEAGFLANIEGRTAGQMAYILYSLRSSQ